MACEHSTVLSAFDTSILLTPKKLELKLVNPLVVQNNQSKSVAHHNAR